MSAHQTPEEIRKGLTHPVIDGDGHWVEYAPVFAERIRKVTGDLGANGFLQSQRRGPDSLSMTLEQRTERGVAMEGFWGRQSTNTRDRATAIDRKSTRLNSSHLVISYAVFCLKKKKTIDTVTRYVTRTANIVWMRAPRVIARD